MSWRKRRQERTSSLGDASADVSNNLALLWMVLFMVVSAILVVFVIRTLELGNELQETIEELTAETSARQAAQRRERDARAAEEAARRARVAAQAEEQRHQEALERLVGTSSSEAVEVLRQARQNADDLRRARQEIVRLAGKVSEAQDDAQAAQSDASDAKRQLEVEKRVSARLRSELEQCEREQQSSSGSSEGNLVDSGMKIITFEGGSRVYLVEAQIRKDEGRDYHNVEYQCSIRPDRDRIYYGPSGGGSVGGRVGR